MTHQKHELIAPDLGRMYHSQWIVSNISLKVKSGEIIGLMGPNGAGKTTLFYMMVGLIKVNKGSIKLDNQDITQYPMHKRARMGIGYLPQEASIFRKLNVKDNIMAILETRKELTKNGRNRQLELLLNEFNIENISSSLGINLSGGERRRVEIARSLAMSPQFILLDEPFAGVDPISVIDIKKIIQYLKNRDIGILITDHNVRETLDICDRAYIVNSGNIISSGSPKKILSDATVRKIYLGDKFEM